MITHESEEMGYTPENVNMTGNYNVKSAFPKIAKK